jgi:hypothetical protein
MTTQAGSTVDEDFPGIRRAHLAGRLDRRPVARLARGNALIVDV